MKDIILLKKYLNKITHIIEENKIVQSRIGFLTIQIVVSV